MNNIENKIKREFQHREIQPSKVAWDKLSEKLEEQVEDKKNNKLIYYRVAAVLVGLLIGLAVFLNNYKENIKINNTDNNLVSSDKTDTNSDKKAVNKLVKKSKEEEVIAKSKILTPPNKVLNNVHSKSPRIKKTIQNNSKIEPTQLANNVVITKHVTTKNSLNNKTDKVIKNTPVTMINPKLAVKQVNTAKTITTKVEKKHKILMNSSDEDIDNMLASVLSGRKRKKEKLHIQSNKLKYAVENQLNIESKNRMYYLIKTGVDTVESIMASNNNN